MKATLGSSGEIAIPQPILQRLGLAPGDVLDFDDHAPYLKATKIDREEAWKAFRAAKLAPEDDPWSHMSSQEALEALRGRVEPDDCRP